MAKVIINFFDENQNHYFLKYKIFDTSLGRRWLDVIKENQKHKEKYVHCSFYNVTRAQIPSIHVELMQLVNLINEEYEIQLPRYDKQELGHEELNILHSMFEHWGDSIPEREAKGIHFDSLVRKFLRLNELIHQYESALNTVADEFPSMALMFDYYPQTIFRDVEPIDKLNLRYDYNWGDLYLGYNTLGKDWLTTAADNDIDLLERKAVRPQARFAAESWLCFGKKDLEPLDKLIHFQNWYRGLTKEHQEMVPIDNLSEMVLGKFLIGHIIITKELLYFDPVKTNWLLPNSETKRRWNEEVCSKFIGIEKIEVIEND